MNEALYTFEPVHQGDQVTLLLAAVIALGALAGTIFLLRKPAASGQRNYQILGAMLLFFVFLIAASTAFFSGLFMRKMGPVTLYKNSMETPYGVIAYPDISNAYIYVDKQPSIVNPNITRRSSRMLIIEEKNDKAHVFPEANYPIEEMLARMKEVIRK